MNTFYGWNVCVRNESNNWMSQQALELLEPDYWMNWHWNERGKNYPGFVPTIWGTHARQDEASVRQTMVRYPNHTWLFLNEGHLQEQANVTPAQAVDLAFWMLNLARDTGININWCGPNAAINMPALHIGGVSGQEWWREWLRLLRKKGIVRPSAHGIHMYNSTTATMFNQVWSKLVNEWRWQWIGDGPMLITEMCAENQPLQYQKEVMNAAFKVLQTGLLEGPAGENGAMAVFWFAATHKQGGSGNWPNCALTEPDPDKIQTMRLTPLGEHWKSLQAQLK